MKLSLLYLEGAKKQLRGMYGRKRFDKLHGALGFMPRRKIKHSLRVGATAADAGLDADAVEAAILHDYIERGGDLSALQQLDISPRAMRVIRMLSIEEKRPGADDTAEVQGHIEDMLKDRSIDQHEKNIAIIVKSADRIDNVKKRVKLERLTPEYFQASLRLFQTLQGGYRGDDDAIRTIKRKVDKICDKARQFLAKSRR